MNKEKLIKKLTSRKFLMTAITAIAGIITMIVGDNVVVQTVAGALMTIVPTVVYCVTEGSVDAASVKTVTDATTEAAEKLGASESTINAIEKVGELAGTLAGDEPEKTEQEESVNE